MVFDPGGAGTSARKQPHPIEDAAFGSDPWTARIGNTLLDDTCARGSLTGPRTASWELRIAAGGEPVKLLTERQYSARFPSAKTQVRSPLARFDGHIVVDDVRFDVDGWTGSVNHNWGRRHTPGYAFGQVCGFDDAPLSSLEIVTARAGLGPITLPPVTLLVFRHDGREFAVRSVMAARRTSAEYRPFQWSFSVGSATSHSTDRSPPRPAMSSASTTPTPTARRSTVITRRWRRAVLNCPATVLLS